MTLKSHDFAPTPACDRTSAALSVDRLTARRRPGRLTPCLRVPTSVENAVVPATVDDSQ